MGPKPDPKDKLHPGLPKSQKSIGSFASALVQRTVASTTESQAQKQKKSGLTFTSLIYHLSGASIASFFYDLLVSFLAATIGKPFQSGNSIWVKTIAAAVIVPIVVFSLGHRREGEKGPSLPTDTVSVVCIAIGCVIGGGILGAALGLKDIVRRRRAAGEPVSLPLKLLFGYGVFSLILVWMPLAIVVLIAGFVVFIP